MILLFPGSQGEGKKEKNMDLMQIISYIREKHLEAEFNKFRTISGNPRQFNYRDESVELCISAH